MSNFFERVTYLALVPCLAEHRLRYGELDLSSHPPSTAHVALAAAATGREAWPNKYWTPKQIQDRLKIINLLKTTKIQETTNTTPKKRQTKPAANTKVTKVTTKTPLSKTTANDRCRELHPRNEAFHSGTVGLRTLQRVIYPNITTEVGLSSERGLLGRVWKQKPQRTSTTAGEPRVSFFLVFSRGFFEVFSRVL